MRWRSRDYSTRKGVFWTMFILTILSNIFAVFNILSISYSDKYKNKLNRIAFFLGLIASTIYYLIIGLFISLDGVLHIIIPIVLIILEIIYIFIVAKFIDFKEYW